MPDWAGIALCALAVVLLGWAFDAFERDRSIDAVHQRRRRP